MDRHKHWKSRILTIIACHAGARKNRSKQSLKKLRNALLETRRIVNLLEAENDLFVKEVRSRPDLEVVLLAIYSRLVYFRKEAELLEQEIELTKIRPGRKSIPYKVALALLGVLHEFRGRGKREDLDEFYEFLKEGGDLATWSKEKYGELGFAPKIGKGKRDPWAPTVRNTLWDVVEQGSARKRGAASQKKNRARLLKEGKELAFGHSNLISPLRGEISDWGLSKNLKTAAGWYPHQFATNRKWEMPR